MPQDDSLTLTAVPPTRGVSLLYLASLAALAVVLVAGFLVAYSLFGALPSPDRLLVNVSYGVLAFGLLLLAAQAALVFGSLVRPYGEAALRVEHLAHALEQNSHRDMLTGALSRTAFDRLIVRELELLRRYGVGFCGIMLDVDGFRRVNEANGYEAGDQTLHELAQLLKLHMRRADFLFRWRSGRFLVLASGIDAEQGRRLAGKLAELVAGHPFRHGVRLSVCMGVAQALPQDAPELFAGRVKSALALAKDQGPGSVALAQE
ncbi:GGDEF domain-containing protein [Humidesulfovibrio sp.]